MRADAAPARTEPRETPRLRFRIARAGDDPRIIDLLSEAAAWAKARGVERWWPVPFPEEWVAPAVARGDVYLVSIGPETIGTLALTREDPRMWGDVPPDAGYVHRLAVRRALAHRGIGARALDWATSEVRGWGRTKLRLDCLATNASLLQYYLSQGFREVRRVQGSLRGEDRPSVLLEREIAEPLARRRRRSVGTVHREDRLRGLRARRRPAPRRSRTAPGGSRARPGRR